jgi:capsular polysaccharide biosynthesis protein
MDERESELQVKTPSSPEVLAVVEFQPRRVSLRRPVLLRYLAYGVLFAVVGAGVAYAAASLGETTYGARSEIYYQIDAQLPTGFLREDRTLSTQLVKIQSREVLAPVAQAHGLTVDQLSNKVHASVLQDSEILRIEVDDPSAPRAKDLVGAITARYLDGARSASNTDAQDYLQGQIAALDRQRDQLLEQANALEVARQARATPLNPSPAATPAQLLVQTQLQSLLDQRSALESRLDGITIDQIRQPRIQELTSPYVLDSPVSPKPWRAAGAGALAGLAVAGLVVALLIRRDLPERRAS